jgi:hypothetical protein
MAGYEHALFLLLLLGFLLRDLQGRHQVSLYLIVGGLLLVLLPPIVNIKIPWELILGLVLPWILWQSAHNWLQISWRFQKREVLLWILTVLCLGLIVYFIGGLYWIRAAFFGIIAASMFWYLSRQSDQSGLLEVIGPLTLIILLIETSLPLNEPRLYLGSLFSGAGIGIILAILSITVMKKISVTYARWILLGQVYLSYWIAFALITSPIAATLIGVIVFTEFYLIRLEAKDRTTVLFQFDNSVLFYILLTLFVFTSWQAHQPIGLVQWSEVILSLLAGLLIAFLGQKIGVHRFEHLSLNWRNSLKLGLFLFGILLLWPRGSEIRPVLIWFALGLAVFLPVLSAILLAVLRDLRTQRNEKYMDDF